MTLEMWALQASTPSWPSLTDIIMGAAALVATAINFRFSSTVSGIRLDIKTEGDKIKETVWTKIENLERKFIPGDLANEHRSQLVAEVKRIGDEVNRNRDRIHDMSNSIQTSIFANISELTRNLHELEKKTQDTLRAIDEQLRDMEDRILECERCITAANIRRNP